MKTGQLTRTFLAFLFGLAMGTMGAVTVVREAVPLRNHVVMIGIYLAGAVPMVLIVFFWYLHVVRTFRKLLGEKAGALVSNFTTLVFVGLFVMYLLVVGLFYAATY